MSSAPLGICAGIGGVVALFSLVRMMRIENRMYHQMGGFIEALFPSPESKPAGGE